MSCEACERAEHTPHTGIFQNGCMNCEARAIAQSPEAHKRDGDNCVAVYALMRRIWPIKADFQRGRSMVFAWVDRLKAKEPQCE
jgi:hypothetical protein